MNAPRAIVPSAQNASLVAALVAAPTEESV
jgi:hypothetical protein